MKQKPYKRELKSTPKVKSRKLKTWSGGPSKKGYVLIIFSLTVGLLVQISYGLSNPGMSGVIFWV